MFMTRRRATHRASSHTQQDAPTERAPGAAEFQTHSRYAHSANNIMSKMETTKQKTVSGILLLTTINNKGTLH
jgi:hypothetical protein